MLIVWKSTWILENVVYSKESNDVILFVLYPLVELNGSGCTFHRWHNKHSNKKCQLRLLQERYELAVSDSSKVIGWAVELICWTDALESAELRPPNNDSNGQWLCEK